MASDWFVNLSKADIKYLLIRKRNLIWMASSYSWSSLQVKTKGENFKKFLPPNYSSSRQSFCWEWGANKVFTGIYIFWKFPFSLPIQKLIFVGYMMYSWIVLAARFTFWHKLYVNFKLNSNLIVYIINRGYYTAARRYELYFRVVKNNILFTCCARS